MLPGGSTVASGKDVTTTRIGVSEGAGDVTSRKQAEEVLLKGGPAARDFQQRQLLKHRH
jgi:hypothetical protein